MKQSKKMSEQRRKQNEMAERIALQTQKDQEAIARGEPAPSMVEQCESTFKKMFDERAMKEKALQRSKSLGGAKDQASGPKKQWRRAQQRIKANKNNRRQNSRQPSNQQQGRSQGRSNSQNRGQRNTNSDNNS